jgi:PST family polysaccharide transporter
MNTVGKKFASGSSWLALGAASDYAVQFIIFAVLARLVSVTELGIVAFTLVLTDVGRVFVNGGRAELMVWRSEWDDQLASAAFTRTLISAIAMAVVLATAGGWIMEHHYQHGSGFPAAALSLIFVIEALRTVATAKMRREFRFRALAARSIIGTAISGSIAIAMALHGYGVWALVAQRLIGQSVTTTLTLMTAHWRPHLVWSDPGLAETAAFTRPVTLSRALEVALLRLPDFLIGLLLGPVAVALYRVGARALEVIMRIVVQPLQDVSLSAYARLAEPHAVGQALGKTLRAAMLLLIPIFVGAAIVAQDLVPVLFGQKYAASGPIMAALSIGAAPQAMLMMINSAYLGSGQARVLLAANLAGLAVTGGAIVAGAMTGGAAGAAIATAAAQCLLLFLGFGLMRRFLRVQMLPIMRSLDVPATASIMMASACIAAQRLGIGILPPLQRLAATSLAGMVSYVLFLAVTYRAYLRPLLVDLRPIAPDRFRRFLPS